MVSRIVVMSVAVAVAVDDVVFFNIQSSYSLKYLSSYNIGSFMVSNGYGARDGAVSNDPNILEKTNFRYGCKLRIRYNFMVIDVKMIVLVPNTRIDNGDPNACDIDTGNIDEDINAGLDPAGIDPGVDVPIIGDLII